MELTGLLFYLVSVLIAGGIYAILCLALNIQWGMGGLFNAGIAGFFAVGAYTSAIVTTAATEKHLGGFDLPIPFGLAAAAIVAGVTGWAVAKICVRLKSDYLAMASVGIAEILRLVIVNEQWLTNGSLGISGVPRPFGDTFQGRSSDIAYLAVVWVIVAVVYIICQRLNDSPWGRTLRAIRDNEASARAGRTGSFRTLPMPDDASARVMFCMGSCMNYHAFMSGKSNGGGPARVDGPHPDPPGPGDGPSA